MDYSEILKCIADLQRLRILNLLAAGPLCVCHIQEIIDAPQVKVSKQLATMKQLGLIESKREGTWMVYRLSEPVPSLLKINLEHLCCGSGSPAAELTRDLKARDRLVKKLSKQNAECPAPVSERIRCC
jgi:ArsR family transcriptional regulator